MRRLLAALALLCAAGTASAVDPADWAAATDRIVDGPEARIVIRTGDIDNLNWGWPAGFDPFSGKSTPPHGFPFKPKPGDPDGTDRIMVGSGVDPKAPDACATGSDGYARETTRPDNLPRPIVVDLGDLGAPPTAVLVQMFIDDFQHRRFDSDFQVSLNGERLPLFEQALAKVDQTGPIGKLISIKIFPEQFRLFEGGKASFLIDDPTSRACDGYGIDFVRLLIDPKPAAFPVDLEGVAVDADTGRAIEGVVVQAALGSGETIADGTFRIEKLPAGLVTALASHPDYESDMEVADLEAGKTGKVRFEMKKRKAEAASIGKSLDENGRVVIPGIYFDTAKATLRPDSDPALKALLGVMTERADAHFIVEGHTDNEGDDTYNLKLSQDRAAAVVAWLAKNGIDAARLSPKGFGEERPVADNTTPTGRQLNRRVEVALETKP